LGVERGVCADFSFFYLQGDSGNPFYMTMCPGALSAINILLENSSGFHQDLKLYALDQTTMKLLGLSYIIDPVF
jgi:hypothetical protein